MKKAVFGLVFFAGLLFTCISAFAQPVMPDYSTWPKTEATYSRTETDVIIDGKTVTLPVEFYQFTDLLNLRRYYMNLMYREDNTPWFALMTEQVGEKKPDGTVGTKEVHYYLFENNDGKWTLARDFTESAEIEKESDEFLKTRYHLEFKQ